MIDILIICDAFLYIIHLCIYKIDHIIYIRLYRIEIQRKPVDTVLSQRIIIVQYILYINIINVYYFPIFQEYSYV